MNGEGLTAEDAPPAARLYLVADREEIVRRRPLVPPGHVVEAWPDLERPGAVWIGEETRAVLEAAGPPLAVALSLPADAVAVFYGPRLCDLESLPREESLRARVVSAHGIAVAWITLDRFGQRTVHEPQSPADPVFHLRRVGGGAGHLWRLFRTRDEAVACLTESDGADSEGAEWARGLAVADFRELLRRHGERA